MNATAEWLARAALWRTASLVFRPPTEALRAELRALAAELPAGERAVAERFAAVPLEDWSAEYHRVLGPGGCPASESGYDDSALAGRGTLLAEISGYYRAFAYEPAGDVTEVPDHLAVELGFLGYLAFKSAFAAHERSEAELDVAGEAYAQFLSEHPRFWVGRLAERLAASDSDLYLAAGRWVEGLCGVEKHPMQPVEVLMTEHRLIEQVLDALERFGARVGDEGEDARAVLREFVAFFRSFADRHHHGKEEELLFRSMVRHGFSLSGGPLAVMLAEHDEGRAHITALARIGNAEGPLDASEQAEARKESLRFATLLRQHIQKEDMILYPMALNALPPDEIDRLATQFAEFESAAGKSGALEGFRAAASALATRYAPEAAS